MKKILVVCATGTATAAVVGQALGTALRARGLEAEISLCAIADVQASSVGQDLIVSTTPISVKVAAPVVQTLAFLTGVEVDAVVGKIVSVLQGQGAG
jgi:PTS system galactitol-specific IIB component